MSLGWGFLENQWYLLDATCFEFTKERKLVEFIDWNHNSNKNNSITHTGDLVDYEKKTVTQTISISLSKLDPATRYLVFAITAYLQLQITLFYLYYLHIYKIYFMNCFVALKMVFD